MLYQNLAAYEKVIFDTIIAIELWAISKCYVMLNNKCKYRVQKKMFCYWVHVNKD